MTDYRDDWKYSKPIPRVEADKRYRDNWDQVFAKKAKSLADLKEPQWHLEQEELK